MLSSAIKAAAGEETRSRSLVAGLLSSLCWLFRCERSLYNLSAGSWTSSNPPPKSLLFCTQDTDFVLYLRMDYTAFGDRSNRDRVVLLVLLLWAVFLTAQPTPQWVGSWAAAQQLVEPHNSLTGADLPNATLRQVVHLSVGGTQLRLRVSNRFGTAPLRIASVHVAQAVSPTSSKISASSDKALSSAGRHDVVIPAGADYLSDPITMPVTALSDLAITFYADLPSEQTGHPGSRAASYLVHGDLTSAAELIDAKTVDHWYFIAGIDVLSSAQSSAVVVLGDSITDGHGATTNGNDRWPDQLAKRLQSNPTTRDIAVLNQGIGGNRMLMDGLGPNALARFNDDVIAQTGARYLIVLEGINDIGMLGRTGEATPAEHDQLAREIIGAYEQIVERAHIHGIKVAGCTVLPFMGSDFYHPGPASESDRQAVNQWIRTPGHFDVVIDFDQVMRDPANPGYLLPKFDSGDHLHPSPAGYAAMSDAVPLTFFIPEKVSGRTPKATGRSTASHPDK